MRKIAAVVILVSLLVACSEKETPPAASAAPAEGKKEASAPAPAPAAANSLLVSIIPEPPTADGCLKALVAQAGGSAFRWRVNGEEVTGSSGDTLCEGFRRGDEVEVTVTAGRDTGSRSVIIENAAPRITEVAVNADAVLTHGDLVVEVKVTDADGDPVDLRYEWSRNGEPDPFLADNALPAGSYARGDVVRFTVVPTDGLAEGKPYQSDALTVPNAPPQILSTPPQDFETVQYVYQPEAFDPDGDPLSFTLAEGPAGMSIDAATGRVIWPLAGVRPGEYAIRIVVSDSAGAEATQAFSMTLGEPKRTANP